MTKKFLRLNDVPPYRRALSLSEMIWDIVKQWDYFLKDTIGKQFVRSIDSISANIAEGFGRYFKKDKIKFYRYSNGSLYESYDWSYKALQRKAISQNQYDHCISELRIIEKELNGLIKITNTNLSR